VATLLQRTRNIRCQAIDPKQIGFASDDLGGAPVLRTIARDPRAWVVRRTIIGPSLGEAAWVAIGEQVVPHPARSSAAPADLREQAAYAPYAPLYLLRAKFSRQRRPISGAVIVLDDVGNVRKRRNQRGALPRLAPVADDRVLQRGEGGFKLCVAASPRQPTPAARELIEQLSVSEAFELFVLDFTQPATQRTGVGLDGGTGRGTGKISKRLTNDHVGGGPPFRRLRLEPGADPPHDGPDQCRGTGDDSFDGVNVGEAIRAHDLSATQPSDGTASRKPQQGAVLSTHLVCESTVALAGFQDSIEEHPAPLAVGGVAESADKGVSKALAQGLAVEMCLGTVRACDSFGNALVLKCRAQPGPETVLKRVMGIGDDGWLLSWTKPLRQQIAQATESLSTARFVGKAHFFQLHGDLLRRLIHLCILGSALAEGAPKGIRDHHRDLLLCLLVVAGALPYARSELDDQGCESG
jgi:hypothetical protein